MANMHRVTGWTAARIEEERFIFLVAVENTAEVSLTEEVPSAEVPMGFYARQFLEAVKDCLVDFAGSECVDELLVVDSIFIRCLDIEGIYGLCEHFSVRGNCGCFVQGHFCMSGNWILRL
jgi:hypothetical protein